MRRYNRTNYFKVKNINNLREIKNYIHDQYSDQERQKQPPWTPSIA